MHLICPICRRELDVSEDFEHRPFCSNRCRRVDLHHWLTGKYRFSEPLSDMEAEPGDGPEDGETTHH